MKIARRLRDIHQDCLERYTLLSNEVRELLRIPIEERNWFYLSRLKKLESFALKVETGRVSDPNKVEDFFACTIVVPTMKEVQEAEELVCGSFKLDNRRPRQREITHKPSFSFAFDDLRLYVARQPSASGRHPEIDGIVFEVQIKTILQHAWSLATHDLIYKADTVSWPLERIAFQVKAMLEHAEVAIDKAGSLSEGSSVAKSDRRTIIVRELMGEIKRVWTDDRLPTDLKRLAENILNILRIAGPGEVRFQEVIASEQKRLGVLPYDLSPYALTLQALAHFQGIDFQRKFLDSRITIFVHDDMQLPEWMQHEHSRIVRV